jgi:hypothetical protein
LAETQQEESLKKLVGTYYKTSTEKAKLAKCKQAGYVVVGGSRRPGRT